MSATTDRGYTETAKALHWLIVVLLIVQFIVAWTMPHIGRNTRPETLINLHFTLGAVVLVVAVLRMGWRMMHREPAPESGIPPWQRTTARIVHWLLYLLLFIVPILGWMNASWRGFSVALFGIPLPKLLATRAPGWAWTGDVHELLANYVMLTLIGLHVAAAIYHWLVVSDGVMQRMMPSRWS